MTVDHLHEAQAQLKTFEGTDRAQAHAMIAVAQELQTLIQILKEMAAR